MSEKVLDSNEIGLSPHTSKFSIPYRSKTDFIMLKNQRLIVSHNPVTSKYLLPRLNDSLKLFLKGK